MFLVSFSSLSCSFQTLITALQMTLLHVRQLHISDPAPACCLHCVKCHTTLDEKLSVTHPNLNRLQRVLLQLNNLLSVCAAIAGCPKVVLDQRSDNIMQYRVRGSGVVHFINLPVLDELLTYIKTMPCLVFESKNPEANFVSSSGALILCTEH